MSSFRLSTIVSSLLLALVLTLSGCGKNDDETVDFYEGPIVGWSDIAIPEEAEWDHSLMGGVENHYYTVEDMEEGELFAWVEMAMETNGWQLNASKSDVRQFIKDGDLATYNSNGVKDDILTFVVIIEPEGIYDGSSDEEEEGEES